jgi:hypothetical protein
MKLFTRNKFPPRGSFDYLLEDIIEKPRVAVPPPPPPRKEEPGRPRITVNIEINQVKPAQKRHQGASLVWLIVLVLVLGFLLAGCAQAQPTQWQSYRQGFNTMFEGTDGEGRTWTGRAWVQGFTTYADFNGPDGKVLHCQTYELSGITHTNCSP